MAGGIDVAGVATRLRDPKAALREVQAYARSRGGWAQLLDAGRILGKDHILSAFEHARRAFAQGTNSTESLEMELLLYASGERQISRAIAVAGVRARRPFALVCGGLRAAEVIRRAGWRRDDGVLGPSPAKLRSIGVSGAEARSAGSRAADLVLERVARVDLLK